MASAAIEFSGLGDVDVKSEEVVTEGLGIPEPTDVDVKDEVQHPPTPRPSPCKIPFANAKPFVRSSTATAYDFGPVFEDVKSDGARQRKSINVGKTFISRDAARLAGIHKSAMSGIVGSGDVGCPSISMNGGYEDNEDYVYSFTYTGGGGKIYQDGSQGGPSSQGEDQTWSSPNRALFKSYVLEYPVRVMRGFKNPSSCAPSSGYRYDGLYQIVFCWIQRSIGLGGHKVIKFAFQRLPNQPRITREGKIYSEPEYISKGLTRDWLRLPDYFCEVKKGSRDFIEPSCLDLGDGMGVLTPHEFLQKQRRRETAGGADRHINIFSGKLRVAPYHYDRLPPRVPVKLEDAFGREIDQLGRLVGPGAAPPAPQEPKPKPEIKKMVRRHDPYSNAVYRSKAQGVRNPPSYMDWVRQCTAEGRAVEI